MSREAHRQLVRREQRAVAEIFRDAAALASRGLDPAAVRMEHAPTPGDNLVFDGMGWFVHMHLAPYGCGLLFELVVSDGEVRGIARPMAERFPIGTWRASIFVDLEELMARGEVASEVVAAIVGAARSRVLEPRTREHLEARLAEREPVFHKLLASPDEPVEGSRTFATVNFEAPVEWRTGCSLRTQIEGASYRVVLAPKGGAASAGLSRFVQALGGDGAAFGAALAALEPGRLAIVEDPASTRPCRLTLGAGLFGHATVADAAWALRVDALPVLSEPPETAALLSRIEAVSRGYDDAGRHVHQVAAAPSGAADARSLAALLEADPHAWLAAVHDGPAPGRRV